MARMGGEAYATIGAEIRGGVVEAGSMELVAPDEAALERYREMALQTHEWWIENTPNGRAVYDAALEEIARIRGS
jgi:hypothetical protein